jgi:hypothetical protein
MYETWQFKHEIFYSSKRTPQTFQRNHSLTNFQYVNITLTISEAVKAVGCFFPNFSNQATLFYNAQVSLALSLSLLANLELICVIFVHHKLGKGKEEIRVFINATVRVYHENRK